MHGTINEGKERAEAMVALGHTRMAAGDRTNARAMFEGALSVDGNSADACHRLAVMVVGQGRYEATVALCRRAVAINPQHHEAWAQLSNALWRDQRFEEAEAAARRAIELKSDYSGAYHNLGLIYYSTGRAEQAVTTLRRSIELKPEGIGCKQDLALAMLKVGELQMGFELSEVRWDGILAKNPIWECGLPKWEGQPLQLKTLLVHHEQGFGDTLQFIRFLPRVKKTWRDDRYVTGAPRIVFAAPKTLHRLLEGTNGIDELIDIDSVGEIVAASRRADYHCPLLSVVNEIGISYDDDLAEGVPYLRAPGRSPLGVRRNLHPPGIQLAIGLVWAASPGHERSRQRSVPLADLLDLGSLPGVKLYSLQVGPYADELVKTGADHLVTDAVAGVRDFADTAVIVDQLDLVVTVDTGMVHLAGAMNKPTFMLNPINPCWRWAKGAKPWYPSVTLFDQVDRRNWDKPIADIKTEIVRMLDLLSIETGDAA